MSLDLPLATWLGLVGTPLLIAAGQVLFKMASRDVGAFDAGGIIGLASNPHLLLALALYGSGTIVWIHVLRTVPLTVAYSFMALTFCVVPILANFFFAEPLSWKYGLGVVLIMAGLLMINTQRV